jgi:hypothetical protein
MKIRTLMIPMLGLTILIRPALGSISFYTGTGANTAYNNAMAAMPGLTAGGPYTFTGANLSGDSKEYLDPTTLIDFFAFSNNNSSSPGPAITFSVSSTRLFAASGAGSIEITLPPNVFAFGANITVPSGFGIFCGSVDTTDSGCSNQLIVTGSGDTKFFGVVSSTAISTIWIGTSAGASPGFVDFQYATGSEASTVPEAKSILLLGAGLVLLGLLRRRFHPPAAGPSSQC